MTLNVDRVTCRLRLVAAKPVQPQHFQIAFSRLSPALPVYPVCSVHRAHRRICLAADGNNTDNLASTLVAGGFVITEICAISLFFSLIGKLDWRTREFLRILSFQPQSPNESFCSLNFQIIFGFKRNHPKCLNIMEFINNSSHVYDNNFYQSYPQPPTAGAQQSPIMSPELQTYQYYYEKAYQQPATPTTSVSSASQTSLNGSTLTHAIGSPVALSPPSSNGSNSNMAGMSTQTSPQPMQQPNLAQTQSSQLTLTSHASSTSSAGNSHNAQQQPVQQQQQTTSPQLNAVKHSATECVQNRHQNGYYNPGSVYSQHAYGYQVANNVYTKSSVNNGLQTSSYNSSQPIASPNSTASTPPVASNNRQQQSPVTSNASSVVQQQLTPQPPQPPSLRPPPQLSPPHLVASHQVVQQTGNCTTVASQQSLPSVASPQQQQQTQQQPATTSIAQQTHLHIHATQHVNAHQYPSQTVYQQQQPILSHPTPPPSVQPNNFSSMVVYENNNTTNPPNTYNPVYSQDSTGNQWTNGNINNISNSSYHSLQPVLSPPHQPQVQYEDVKPFRTTAYNHHVHNQHPNITQAGFNEPAQAQHPALYHVQFHPSQQQTQHLQQQHQQHLLRVQQQQHHQQQQQQHQQQQSQHLQRQSMQMMHSSPTQAAPAKKRSRAKGKEKNKKDSKRNGKQNFEIHLSSFFFSNQNYNQLQSLFSLKSVA